MVSLRSQSGFSLVELSIVLVILGLLTGGILGGQALIRAAELRSTISDTSRYSTALNSFRDKYLALPGDMPNAQSFWGVLNGSHATCITTAATGTATCNGDGNGQIVSTNGSHYDESFRAWQHLANAGLIEGNYTGTPGPTANGAGTFNQAILGTNVPRLRISNGGTSLAYLTIPIVDPNWFPIQGNVLLIGAMVGDNFTTGPLLKPEEAWNLDTKLDDGVPGTGAVITPKNTAPNCATTNAPATAVYALNNVGQNCALAMKTGN